MKKLCLILGVMLLMQFSTSSALMALEKTVFGPMFIKKEKGKAKPVLFTFPAEEVTAEDNCTLLVQPFQGNKVGTKIVLNGVEIVSKRDKFVDGEISVPVQLLAENEISITVFGKPGTAVVPKIIVISPDPTELTLYCATRDSSGIMIEGASVEVQMLDETELTLTGITGEDGACNFPGMPVEGAILVTATYTDEQEQSLQGTDFVIFSPSKDYAVADILLSTGTGAVSGNVTTEDGTSLKGIVCLHFNNGYEAFTMSNADGHFSFSGLPLDGYFTLSLATPNDSIVMVGSVIQQLTEANPVRENLNFSVKPAPCPVNADLFNGDFENGLLHWKQYGFVGITYQSRYFSEEDYDMCGDSGDETITAQSSTTDDIQISTTSSTEIEPGEYCGIVCTTDEKGKHYISQYFKILSDKANLEFDWRYHSEEFRYNNWSGYDQFTIKLVTQKKTHILHHGTTKTIPMEPFDLSFGLNGISPVMHESFMLNNMAGQSVYLVFEVIGIGDILTSYLVIDNIKITEKGMFFHSKGLWNLPTYTKELFKVKAGEKIEFRLKNQHNFWCTSLEIRDLDSGEEKFYVIPPMRSQVVTFSKPCFEPTYWRFFLRTNHSNNPWMPYEIYST